MEGLRYLPDVQARRSKLIDKGAPGEFLDCEPCRAQYTLFDRRCLGCGWMPASEHIAGDRPYPEASVCPGYTIRLPEVLEAARAKSWSGRGGLVPLYGNRRLPQYALDAIDVLEGATIEADRRDWAERKAEAERERG